MRREGLVVVVGLGLAVTAFGAGPAKPPAPVAPVAVKNPRVIHRVLTYIPNRVVDLLDVVRARVRIGFGYGVSLRATDYADFHAGSYNSLYVGLPGPRCRKAPKPPIGPESRTGVEIGNAMVRTTAAGPGYSPTEVGLGLHAGVVGADVGIDPMEIVDFLGGFFFWDPRHDDF